MKKSNALRLLVAAVTVPAIGLGMASPASADGNVRWQNARTGMCLGSAGDYVTMEICGSGTTIWHDNQQPDTNWLEMSTAKADYCLDSNNRGSVYLGPCDEGNRNQRWSEEKWRDGWVLRNVATNRCLSGGGYHAKTYPCNADNAEQFWK